MSLELAAVRALAPYFGASVFVWTNVLGIVLAALSLGYFVAGRLADRWTQERSLAVALIAGGGLAALSPFLAQALASALLPSDLRLEDSFSIFWGGSLAVGALAFGPPAFLLSFSSPAAIRFLAVSRPVGEISGRVFALSTVGSILGTFLTTYFLVPSLGTRWTFALAGSAVLVPAALLLWRDRAAVGPRNAKLGIWIPLLPWAAFAGTAIFAGNTPLRVSGLGDLVEERETLDQFVQLRESGKQRWIQVNEGLDSFQSMWIDGEAWTQAYYDFFLLAPALAEIPRGAPLRVGILGLGGGSASRLLHLHEGPRQALEVDGVEIDAGLVALAQAPFALDAKTQPHLRIASGKDARVFLRHVAKAYEVILLDAYAAQLQIPFHLASREFFELVAARLADGGVLAINIGVFRDPGRSGEIDPSLEAIASTASAVFGKVCALPVPKTRNVVVFCRKGRALPEFSEPSLVQERNHLRTLLAYASYPQTVLRWKSAEQTPSSQVLTDDRSSLERIQILSLLSAQGERGR